jgi:hypothetical protein
MCMLHSQWMCNHTCTAVGLLLQLLVMVVLAKTSVMQRQAHQHSSPAGALTAIPLLPMIPLSAENKPCRRLDSQRP